MLGYAANGIQTFKNPKPELIKALEEAGENGIKRGGGPKRKGKSSNVCIFEQ
jgi:hypothetical protein